MTASERDRDTYSLERTVWSNPARRGGAPCLVGTRFPAAQAVCEIAKDGADAFADNMDIDKALVHKFVAALARSFNKQESQP